METNESMKPGAEEKASRAIPLPEHFERTSSSIRNPPQKAAGTNTPGKNEKQELTAAAEREARRNGKAPDSKK